jgi:two-component system cell cycle response regulator
MPSASVIAPLRVALLGFSDFERSALVSYLRLSGTRVPAYVEADSVAVADYLIADADHSGTLDLVLGADRASDTIFIGSLAPDGALAWMMRPIDPMQVFRDLDAAVVLRRSRAQALLPAATRTAVAATVETAGAKPTVQAPQGAAPRPTKRGLPRRVDDLTAPTSALLVDDSEVALRFLERQLQALGLRTETASDSQRALALLGTQTYDAVFLDVELGENSELDGLGLCQHIKRQLKPRAGVAPPVVVMVSAHTATTDRVRGSFAGCDAYLAKPLDDEVLRRSLRALGLRLSAPVDTGHSNSRPGNLLSRPMPLDRSG